jgi:hypothetical protein
LHLSPFTETPLRIGILNNLRAGRSNAQVRRILHFLSDYPEVAHVETDCAEAVPEALSVLERQDVELLVVNGGDGTLQHAFTEILGNREFGDRVPLIAPLRGGRTNMTALDLGTHRDPIRSLSNLIEASRLGSLEERVTSRQVLRVEYGPGRQLLYGMFFGVGMIYRAIDLVHRVFPQGRARGVMGSTLVTAGLIGRVAMLRDSSGILMPDKVQVLLDGELMRDGAYTLMIASTLNRLFARMRPFWGVGPGNVRFTTIATGAQDVWRAAPGILRGRPRAVASEENGYTSRNAKRVELRFDCGFTVDGEMAPPEIGRTVSVTAEDTVRFVRA